MSPFIRLLSLLALLGFASSAQAVIPDTERAVLMNLYNSTNGANWTNNTGWLGEPGTECGWFGVGCDSTLSHVTVISLAGGEFLDGGKHLGGNNLVGILPSLSGLTALQHFYVSGNQLTGSIPSLSGLTALVGFDVAHNQLTGSIPTLSGLTALQYFHAFNNQLTGIIPSLSGLMALQGFSVNDNQLTGSIPSLSGLSALQYFYAFNNQLTGIIPSLSGLTALKGFGVAGNQLTGSIPSLSELIALEEFSVANNQLTGAVPATSSSLVAGRSYLCTNNLTSSGDPTIDAAWDTATGVDWLACQSGASVVPVITLNFTNISSPSSDAIVSLDGITGLAPLTVDFSASASSSDVTDVLTYTWSFGDGQTGTGTSAQHTYSSAGTYTASLIVDNGQGQSASPTKTFTVVASDQSIPSCSTTEILLNNVCVLPSASIASGSFSEPNNTPAEATPILVNDQPIFQLFTSPTDEDWFEVHAEAGERYTIDIPTSSVGKSINPVLELYDAAGTLLNSKVNNGSTGQGEQLQFTAPSTGLFSIRVTHDASLARAAPDDEAFKGEAIDYSYQIRVFLTDAPLQALTKGRVLDPCNLGIIGADVAAKLNGVSARSTLTNKSGEFGLLLNPGNYELNIFAIDYQQASQSVSVGQDSIALPEIRLTPTTNNACAGDNISRAQQAPVVYDDQTGQLIVKDVVLDGSEVYYVELQNIGDFRFQLTRMLTLPGVIHSNPPVYSSSTSLADLPKVFALDQNWRVQMKHIGDGVLPLESAEPY